MKMYAADLAKSETFWRDSQSGPATRFVICDVHGVIKVFTDKYTADLAKSKTVLEEFSATRFVICDVHRGHCSLVSCRHRFSTETYNAETKKYGTFWRESQLVLVTRHSTNDLSPGINPRLSDLTPA